MLIRHLILGVLPVVLTALGAGVAFGQDYPSKPIRIVTAAPGGNADFAARLIGQGLTVSLRQPVIVENRPNGPIPYEIGAKASPDGYTVLAAAENLWVGQFLQKVPYDPVRDFAPITWLVTAPNILVVHPSSPAKSVKDLIALAKARPGDLNYASTGSGSSSHRAVELFKAMSGVNIVHIPYKGTGPALNDLIGGRVQLMMPVAAATIPHVKSGRLRALAVTSAEPSALAPGLPTVAASGVPGYESVLTLGMFAPAKTPAVIVSRLNQEIVRILDRADVKERFFNAGAEVVGSSPKMLADTMKSDIAKWGKLIKDAGIRAE